LRSGSEPRRLRAFAVAAIAVGAGLVLAFPALAADP
jgi:hypothetical protein